MDLTVLLAHFRFKVVSKGPENPQTGVQWAKILGFSLADSPKWTLSEGFWSTAKDCCNNQECAGAAGAPLSTLHVRCKVS